MKSIAVENIKEEKKGAADYLLIRLSVNRKESYCACVDGEGFAIESLGSDYSEAERIFGALVLNQVSALHLAEIMQDIRAENFG